MSDEDRSFIDRWARRKAGVQGGLQRKDMDDEPPRRGRMITEPIPSASADLEEVDEHVTEVVLNEVDSTPIEAGSEVEARSDPEDEIAELERVDIEALDFDADFTRFMQPGVPDTLRQRALRRLWRTNPILANVDGLNDYDEDYTDAALAVDALKSSYKVGQGFLTDEEAAERDAALIDDADVVESETDVVADVDVDGSDASPSEIDDVPETDTETDVTKVLEDDEDDTQHASNKA